MEGITFLCHTGHRHRCYCLFFQDFYRMRQDLLNGCFWSFLWLHPAACHFRAMRKLMSMAQKWTIDYPNKLLSGLLPLYRSFHRLVTNTSLQPADLHPTGCSRLLVLTLRCSCHVHSTMKHYSFFAIYIQSVIYWIGHYFVNTTHFFCLVGLLDDYSGR